jgi:hypothetical protein
MAGSTLPFRFGMKKSLCSTQFTPNGEWLTNFRSDFLKERLFGLSNPQGNHGESVKECHFHLDNTPSVRRHSQVTLKAERVIDISCFSSTPT